jgi:hypothetical protein
VARARSHAVCSKNTGPRPWKGTSNVFAVFGDRGQRLSIGQDLRPEPTQRDLRQLTLLGVVTPSLAHEAQEDARADQGGDAG